jgi:hypothetical protein
MTRITRPISAAYTVVVQGDVDLRTHGVRAGAGPRPADAISRLAHEQHDDEERHRQRQLGSDVPVLLGHGASTAS